MTPMTIEERISAAAGLLTHGVYVISTRAGEKVNAMTAAWVARTSFDPPLLTVAIAPARFTHGMILESGVFAVNILGPGNIALGRHFGTKTGRKTDKLASIDYDVKTTGSPVLKGCVAWLDCTVHSHHEAGDHTLFVGRVVDAGVSGTEGPLVYNKKSFFK